LAHGFVPQSCDVTERAKLCRAGSAAGKRQIANASGNRVIEYIVPTASWLLVPSGAQF